MKFRKLNIRKLGAVALVFVALTCIVASVYLLFFINQDAYERQEIEESIADDFIENLISIAGVGGMENEDYAEESIRISIDMPTAVHDANEPDKVFKQDEPINLASSTTSPIDKNTQKTYEDLNYYQRNGVTYTPDYAVGYLFCVLEYPKVGIRRGVYSGDWADIHYDLDLWMATTARPDYELGKTHMAIYGHNHTAQNLSFNNLKVASVGDEFTLYSTDGVYVYEVTRIFAEWRSTVSNKLVDDMNIPPDVCYIITCGRDNFLVDGQSSRYKDFIVEGHLKEKLSLTEYAERIYGEELNWRE